jgi:hypothetical protein
MPYARSGSWRIKRPHREDLPNNERRPRREPDEPRRANIGHCRAHDLTHLLIYCTNFPVFCYHDARMPIDRFSDDAMLDDIQARCRCTKCGKKGAEIRPDWAPVMNRRTP